MVLCVQNVAILCVQDVVVLFVQHVMVLCSRCGGIQHVIILSMCVQVVVVYDCLFNI